MPLLPNPPDSIYRNINFIIVKHTSFKVNINKIKTHQNHLGSIFNFSNNHVLGSGWNKPLIHPDRCKQKKSKNAFPMTHHKLPWLPCSIMFVLSFSSVYTQKAGDQETSVLWCNYVVLHRNVCCVSFKSVWVRRKEMFCYSQHKSLCAPYLCLCVSSRRMEILSRQ